MNLKQVLSEEDQQLAHEMLAYVEYRYVNKKTGSDFVCVNLMDYYLGLEPKIENFDAYDGSDLAVTMRRVGNIITKRISAYINGAHTVETYLANQACIEVPDVDPEDAYQFRLVMLADLLKELE